MIYGLTKERIEEIKTKFKTDKDLFNWCQEYNTFINSCVNGCFSQEVDYMLKKSYEDKDSPLSYEDLDLFSMSQAKDSLKILFEDDSERLTEYANNPETFNRKVKNINDFEVFLNSLSKEELKEMCQDFDLDIDSTDAEVFEWWFISDPLKYRLEEQGEIILNDTYWGRCSTGQSISLDWCCIKAFMSLLNDL